MTSKWKQALSPGSARSTPSIPTRQPRRMIDRASSFFSQIGDAAPSTLRSAGKASRFMMADDPAMRARWDVVDLRTLSIVTCFVSILLCGALPLVEQFTWYKYDARLTEITVTNWVVAGCAGILGLVAAWLKKSYLVAFHVIVGGMLGAGLGLFSVTMYYDMNVRCEIMQAAYVGCAGCQCSLQNRCTKEDLLTEACANCAAWPTEVCGHITGFSLTSIMGLLAVIFTSFPVAVNLILLLRMEAQTGEAFKTMKSLDTAELEHQMELLMVGAEPTARPTSINLLIDRVKDHGDSRLAEKANAALNVYRAVKRGPPPTMKSVAQRSTGPKLLNVASLVRRQHEGEKSDMEAGRSTAGGSTAFGETSDSRASASHASSAKPSSGNNRFAGMLKGSMKSSNTDTARSTEVEMMSGARGEEVKVVPVGGNVKFQQSGDSDWSNAMSRYSTEPDKMETGAISTFELDS